ncbi:MAG: type II toxin-antitoxin system Phd/YefM family antitoxin [Alphaproteobacteria bacterium]
MNKHWPVQDAKARFSEFLNAALADGPQFVTRRGKDAAVLLSVEAWEDLQSQLGEARARGELSLKDWLLAPVGKSDALADELAQRRPLRHRPPPDFD